MVIIGINSFHNVSSVSLVIDGQLVACLAEERLNKIKNSSKFPLQAINKIFATFNLKKENVDFFCRNTSSIFLTKEKILFFVKNFAKNKNIFLRTFQYIKNYIDKNNKFFDDIPSEKIINIDHHLSHLESCFLISPFEESVSLSLDGSGDFKSGSYGFSENSRTLVDGNFFYPNSLGLFYQAITQFIGFKNIGDEYKMMGLSAYGSKNLVMKSNVEKLINYKDFNISLNLKMFDFPFRNIEFIKEDEIYFNDLFSDSMQDALNMRARDQFIFSKESADLAFAAQEVYEEIFIKILNDLHLKYSNNNLCYSGGCALNSKANGKIKKNTKFQNIFIPYEPGDAGGASGAALSHYFKVSGNNKFYQPNPYLGVEVDSDSLETDLQNYIRTNKIKSYKFKSNSEMFDKTADLLANNNVIGWFQDRMEFGPRALGNRSILMNPQNKDAKNILNLKIKLRESYRPFAPSIMEEHLHEWFEDAHSSPYMNFVFTIKKEKRQIIPAVCHADNTGRAQTVNAKDNEKFYSLIHAFYLKTGVPMLINTSFNENEPIVFEPKDAIETFLKTKIDYLILQDHLISKI
jgi:carbamoyltransferase